MSDDYVIVLTTMAGDADVEALARTIVEEQLAACVSVLPPMRSIYRWEGQVEEAVERQVVMKTSRASVSALRDRLHELHPYDVPEFLVLPIVDGSEAYLKWISGSVRTYGPANLRTHGPEDPRT